MAGSGTKILGFEGRKGATRRAHRLWKPVRRQFEALRRNRRCACDSACVSGADGESVVFLEDERYGEHNHFSGIKDKINCHQPSGKEYELKVSANIFWVLLFKKGES